MTATSYASGGPVPGSSGYVPCGSFAQVTIGADECLTDRTLTCTRNDPAHRAATIPARSERMWTCPSHDAPGEPTPIYDAVVADLGQPRTGKADQ